MKKFLFTLVACLATVAANAWTVYFTNPNNWSQVCVWAWDSNDNDKNYTGGNWPGKQMTFDTKTGYYTYTGTGTPNKIIFNNGVEGGGSASVSEQTKDLTFEDGATYNFSGVVGAATPPSSLYILGDVNGGTWDPNNGVEMTDAGQGVFTAHNVALGSSVGSAHFSFSEKIAPNWEGLKTRWGAVTNNKEFDFNTAKEASNAIVEGNNDNAFQVAAGTYNVTVSFATLTVTLEQLSVIQETEPAIIPESLYFRGSMTDNNWAGTYTLERQSDETNSNGEYVYKGFFQSLSGDFKISQNPDNWNDINLGASEGNATITGNGTWAAWNNGVDFTCGDETFSNVTLTLYYNPDKAIASYLKVEMVPSSLYLLGEANGNIWDPTKGVEMSADASVFTASNVAINGTVSFSTKLSTSNDWSDLGTRYGANAQSNTFTDAVEGTPVSLVYANDPGAFKVPAGIYDVTVSFADIENPTVTFSTSNLELVNADFKNNESDGNDGSMYVHVDNGHILATTLTDQAVLSVSVPEGMTLDYTVTPGTDSSTTTPENGGSGDSGSKDDSEPVDGQKSVKARIVASDNQITLPLGSGKVDFYFVKNNVQSQTYNYTYTVVKDSALGVEDLETTNEGEAIYFNLQGVKVANPEHGIFIKVQNGKAVKVVR